jgi:hypothetical protein
MAASYASVIALCVQIKYRKFTLNIPALAVGHLASLTALIVSVPRSNLIWCLSCGILVIAFGIAAVTAQRLNLLVEFLDCGRQ